MISVLSLIQILGNIMILALLMKLILDAREFFFNPVFRPIDQITEPLLRKMRDVFRPTKSGWDYTPLVAMGLVLLMESFFFFVLSSAGIVQAFTFAVQSIMRFLLQLLALSVIIAALMPRYYSNPLTKFFKALLEPFTKIFGFGTQGKGNLILLTSTGLVICFTIVWHLVSQLSLSVANDTVTHLHISLNVPQDGRITGFVSNLLNWRSWAVSLLTVCFHIISVYKFILLILFISFILSWVSPDPRNSFVQLIYGISEPILTPIRRMIPTLGGFDFSILVAWILIAMLGAALERGILRLVISLFGI